MSSDVVVVTTSGSGQTGCGSGAHMVGEVARVVGGENESNVRTQALDCINRVRLRLNKRDWRFTKTTASAITLVSGTRTYTLPSAFKSPSFAQLLDTNSKPNSDLIYQDDATFAHWLTDQDSSGQPLYYSLRNSYDDGLVSLYPVPGASEATSFTLRVEYFARIPNIQDTSDAVDLPEEVCDVFVIGGQAYLLRERTPESPAAAQAWQDYSGIFAELVAYDRRVTDEQARFRLGTARAPFGTVYIRA